MTSKPYSNEPDVFVLMLASTTPGITIANFQSDWGETDELLCFYDGTLLGLTREGADPNRLLVSMLPKLNAHRNYPWPTSREFSAALTRCLEEASDWVLRCERDAEQEPVAVIVGRSSLHNAVEATLAYCQSLLSVCPTYLARQIDCVDV